MPKALEKSVLETMTQRLVAEFEPEEIILFGSQAWGTPDDDSDVDLLVIVSDSDLSPSRRAQKAHRCLGGLGVSKDVLVKTRREVERSRQVRTSLVSQILERGRVLHARSPAG
jgi:predicted nucleotidyltransferase